MRITNGSVTFERVKRPADFESIRSGVTLAFAIDDTEDEGAAIAEAGALARMSALAMLRDASAKTLVAPTPAMLHDASAKTLVAPTPAASVAETPAASVAETAPPAITDADLNKALQSSMDAAADRSARAAQLRTLVAQYTGDPLKKVYAIAADERSGFLAALSGI